jgi:hypothetical protein
MKKSCLTLLVLIIGSLCNAQIINFPDANFKARLLAAAPGLQIASGTASIPGNPFVKIDANNDGEIQVSEALAITNLWLYNASITSLVGIENFTNLSELQIYGNNIPNVDLTSLTHLTNLSLVYNNITSLNVTGLSQVQWFTCRGNQLTSLDVTGMITMSFLQCFDNQLTELRLGNANNIHTLYCQNNLLTNLDVSNVGTLVNLNCSSNNLRQLSLKNNSNEVNLDFSNNPNLQYVCADSSELQSVQSKINQYGYANCFTNSFCSFNTANPVYFVKGITNYDELNDGCDNTDISFPNLMMVLSDGTNTGNVYSNSDGEYNTASQSTSVTITPQIENPAYFTITPSSQTVTLSDSVNPFIQNFCVAPNGSHPDLEISIIRTNQGFSAYYYDYILTYKNKGTNTQSGNISLGYDDNVQDFNFSTPAISTSATNLLTWSYSNLKPFENRTILVKFYMNSGMFNPTLFEGDLLTYVANISSSSVDDTPNDNTYTLNEIYSSAVLLNIPNPSFSDYFALYPNPTRDLLNIKTKKNIFIDSIAVFNLLGQSVIQLKNVSNDSSIDVSGLEIGTYLIKISSDKGIFNSKLIKN